MDNSELFPLPDGPVMAAVASFERQRDQQSTASGPRGVGYSLLRWLI
jgi:hypothetical protein